MARRKKDNGGSILLALVALVVLAIAVIGPYAIAGWLIYWELRGRRFHRFSAVADLLSAEERTALAAYETRDQALAEAIERTYATGVAEGLARRQDGLFDARPRRGRALNEELSQLIFERGETADALERLKQGLADRIESWVAIKSSVAGARAALLVFVVVFVVIASYSLSEAGVGLTPQNLLVLPGATGPDHRVIASVGGTLAALLAACVVGASTRSSLSA